MKSGKTVLVVDGGGRGSALVDKYAQSLHVEKILAVPGNDLMQINTTKKVHVYPSLKTTSVKEIIKLCKEMGVDLVDVAQENGVEAGLSDALGKAGFKAIGPTRLAGQIEWDKAWARNFMKKYHLPHPTFKVYRSESQGFDFLKDQPNQAWFIKASGLAEGKGALYAGSNLEAHAQIKKMKDFGRAGKVFLIEACILGEEFSSYALCDGESFKLIGHAQDHKRAYDGDKGPNTGGMGASSPPLVVTKEIEDQVIDIFKATVEGLKKEKRPYLGILYLGGMVARGKVYVIEFNSRWGDPEAQVILPSLKNDLYELALVCLAGKINEIKIELDGLSRVVVAGCSKGYPRDYSHVYGKEIFGLEKALKIEGVKLYGGGVDKVDNKYLAKGGRLFYVVGEGKDVLEAREKAYQGLSQISVEGDNLHFRRDIGLRDVKRLSQIT